MTFSVTQIDAPCGAIVEGLDLTKQLDDLQVKALRQEWLRSHVLIFPNQELSDDDLERYSLYFGHFGHDPFIAPIDGREHVAAVKRKAEEQAPVFAEVWHSDWSFQAVPPAGTCLYSITIPPIGGDTEYINQHKALTEMPADLRKKIEGKKAIHSARAGYSPDGYLETKNRKPTEACALSSQKKQETPSGIQLFDVIRKPVSRDCLAVSDILLASRE